MTHEQQSAGDPIPSKCEVIEVHVAELKQLFNAIDPSPFREKDLDPKAEEFIVSWARDVHGEAQLALLVYLDRRAGLPDEAAMLRDAIREYFGQQAIASRRRLRRLLRVGRTSLAIGIAFLTVAMWRPMEVFLYDWWPIRAEARLFDRLSVTPVRIAYTKDAGSEAWRWDWPAVPPSERTPRPAEAQHPTGPQPLPATTPRSH